MYNLCSVIGIYHMLSGKSCLHDRRVHFYLFLYLVFGLFFVHLHMSPIQLYHTTNNSPLPCLHSRSVFLAFVALSDKWIKGLWQMRLQVAVSQA